MKNSQTYHHYGHTLLRIAIGLMIFLAGIGKISNPAGTAGFLGGIAIFSWAPMFWAWVLILGEVIFGLLVFVGYKVRYTAWPLSAILLIAALFVTAPSQGWTSNNFLFHLIAAFGAATIALTGPGKLALTKT